MMSSRHLFALVAILWFCPHSAHATLLSSLVATNGTIQEGDKLFNNFSYRPMVQFGNSPPSFYGPNSPGSIDVQGIIVAGLNGLQFTGPFFENSTPTQQSFTSYQIQYDVTVTNPSFLIHDLYASFAGTSSGQNFASFDVSTSTITGCTGGGPGEICGIGGGGGPFSVTNNGLLPADISTIHVTELFAFLPMIGSGGDPTGSVTVPSIDVAFSQTQSVAPEPSVGLLVVSGLAGFALRRYRRMT
jgi:hypothetical protein